MVALGISSYPGHCGGELEGEYSGARMEIWMVYLNRPFKLLEAILTLIGLYEISSVALFLRRQLPTSRCPS